MTQYTRTHMQTNPFRTEEATFWLLVYMIVSVRLLVRHHIRYWYICNSINMLNYDNIENLSLCDRLYPSRDRKKYMKINQFEVMIIQKLGWMNKNFTDYHSEAICPIHIIPLSLLSCIDKYRRVFCYNPACVRITVLHPPPPPIEISFIFMLILKNSSSSSLQSSTPSVFLPFHNVILLYRILFCTAFKYLCRNLSVTFRNFPSYSHCRQVIKVHGKTVFRRCERCISLKEAL